MALQRRKSKNKRFEMPRKDDWNSSCNTDGEHVASITGEIEGTCLQRQKHRGRDLLVVGCNAHQPLGRLVCRVAAAFSSKECACELKSCKRVWSLARKEDSEGTAVQQAAAHTGACWMWLKLSVDVGQCRLGYLASLLACTTVFCVFRINETCICIMLF